MGRLLRYLIGVVLVLVGLALTLRYGRPVRNGVRSSARRRTGPMVMMSAMLPDGDRPTPTIWRSPADNEAGLQDARRWLSQPVDRI